MDCPKCNLHIRRATTLEKNKIYGFYCYKCPIHYEFIVQNDLTYRLLRAEIYTSNSELEDDFILIDYIFNKTEIYAEGIKIKSWNKILTFDQVDKYLLLL